MHMRTPYRRYGKSVRVLLGLIGLFLFTGCGGHGQGQYPRYQSPDRDGWQKPQQVIAALELKPGMVVADLGSGTGYFTFRLAEAVDATGKVYAVDIAKNMNDYVDAETKKRGVENVQTLLAQPADPLLPEKVDLIFAVDSYHHLEHRVDYFINAKKYLKPGGRVAIIDFKEGAFHHNTPRAVILDELAAAGYRVDREPTFLRRQNFLIFTLR